MNTDIAKELTSLDFDGTWETLIPLLGQMLDSAEEWVERSDEYHTTQVLTILVSFRTLCDLFRLEPDENPLFADRYKHIASRLLRWYEGRESSGNAKETKYWAALGQLTRLLLLWKFSNLQA